LGYDTRLLRKVWIYKEPAGTPPGIHRQALRRPTRLRWLNGKHTPEESWDAYEAPTGEALLQSLDTPHPWERVRYWLHDLAHELRASLKDSSLPPAVELNRVWLTRDGRAKLLEFPAPGASSANGMPAPDKDSRSAPFGSDDAQLFLKQVAASALAGRPLSPAEIRQGPVTGVLPLPARDFLSQLPRFPDVDRMTAQLTPLLDQAATISRRCRLALTAACCLPALLIAMVLLYGLVFIQQNYVIPAFREIPSLMACLKRLAKVEKAGQTDAARSEREALEIYIAAHSRAVITNEVFREGLETLELKNPRGVYQRMNQILARRPAPSAQEIADATARLKPFLEHDPLPVSFQFMGTGSMILVGIIPTLAYGLGILIAIPSLLAALVFRGGLPVRALGVAFVARDGAPASRWRLLARSLLTWSPILAGLALSPVLGALQAQGIMLALFVLGLTWTLLDPQRGLPDRLVGTWPVPR
jgi:hypothetical protein